MKNDKIYIRDKEHAETLGYHLGKTANEATGFDGQRVNRYRDEPARQNISTHKYEDDFCRAWWRGLNAPTDLEWKRHLDLKPKQFELI